MNVIYSVPFFNFFKPEAVLYGGMGENSFKPMCRIDQQLSETLATIIAAQEGLKGSNTFATPGSFSLNKEKAPFV